MRDNLAGEEDNSSGSGSMVLVTGFSLKVTDRPFFGRLPLEAESKGVCSLAESSDGGFWDSMSMVFDDNHSSGDVGDATSVQLDLRIPLIPKQKFPSQSERQRS